MKVKTYCSFFVKKYFVFILLGIFCIFSLLTILKRNNNDEKVNSEIIIDSPKKETVKEELFVDIKGAVTNPGVYKFAGGTVNDAIIKSGGLIDGADTKYLNLSKKLTNEMVIIIYTKNELEIMKKEESATEVDGVCHCPVVNNDACINNSTIESNKKKETINNVPIIVNINSATKEELMTLSGIGEAKADEIITYRNVNGNFNNIEDILNVKGIGESIFDKIKDKITVS